jgi:hypothetical protein
MSRDHETLHFDIINVARQFVKSSSAHLESLYEFQARTGVVDVDFNSLNALSGFHRHELSVTPSSWRQLLIVNRQIEALICKSGARAHAGETQIAILEISSLIQSRPISHPPTFVASLATK